MLISPLFDKSNKAIYDEKLDNKLGKKFNNILSYKIYQKTSFYKE